MSHYYITDNSLTSKEKNIKYTYMGHEINICSDSGVFSKEKIDYGTNVLLNSLPILKQNSTILDVGCGYGIIGICLASAYPASKVDLIDVNERAIEITKKNIKNNSLKNAECFTSNLFENIENNYDYIISNPPIRAGKEVVHKIVTDSFYHLNNGGELYIVIQKKQGAPSMMEKMNNTFGNVEKIGHDGGYFILVSRKK